MAMIGRIRGRVSLVATSILAGLVAAFALWAPLRSQEQANIDHLTSDAAASMRADLDDDFRSLLMSHVRLGEEWGWEEPSEPHGAREWDENTRLFLDHHPNDLALRLLDPGGRVIWGSEGAPLDADDRDHIDRAVGQPLEPADFSFDGTLQQPFFSPPFSLPDGRTGVRLVVPVIRNGSPYGYLVAVADLGATLKAVLRDHDDLGYAVTVRYGTRRIYSMARSPLGGVAAFLQENALPLPGVTLHVDVSPEPDVVSAVRSSVPWLAAVLGGLLGSALVLTLHFGRSAQSRAHELHDARDRLELRVVERTAALEFANANLEAQIGERARAEESLRNLSGRLLRLQDEERRRIARDLHDSTTQLLAAAKISIDQAHQMAEECRNSELDGLLRDGMESLERARVEIRTVSYLLHPPILDELGLAYVLPWYVEGFTKRSGIEVDLDVECSLGRLPEDVEIALFRIVQETLTNVHRHSGSATARIALGRDADGVSLTIHDEGRGVPASVLAQANGTMASLGVGIAGMRERVRQLGGRLEVSNEARGTTVRVHLPMPSPVAARS